MMKLKLKSQIRWQILLKKILEFNRQNQKKKKKKLKILTPDHMLSRLPITLVQLKAGNNSENLKNEIEKLFSFYCSKKLTKTIYHNLIKTI